MANYHAPRETNLTGIVDTLKKYGVQAIRMQRDVFDPELYFRLMTVATVGDMARMPAYKSAADDERNGQLLTYPALMAHDVAGYDEVYVGQDQKQNLEYAARLLRKYNKAYKDDKKCPTPKIMAQKVMDLRIPTQKMSKSSPQGCLFLDDSPDDIRKKIRAATADEAGRQNLEFLYREFVGGEPPAMNQCLKSELAEAFIGVAESV